MVTITLATNALHEQQVDCIALFLPRDYTLTPHQIQRMQELFPRLVDLLEERKFTGALLQSITVPVVAQGAIKHLFIVGMGAPRVEHPRIDMESYRRALAKAVRLAEDVKAHSLAFELPDPDMFGVDTYTLAEQTASLINIAAYHFDEYITEEDRKISCLKKVAIVSVAQDSKTIVAGIERGSCVAQAVNRARHWIDLPPEALTPIELADKARLIAQDYGLEITVFTEADIIKMGMGGLAAVSRGSQQDCQLVIMHYKTSKKDAPTIALVGKGITFDSGGLSIKPAVNMETMKEDMSGAAAVIATMQVIGQLKPDINVIGVTPLSENLPSGTATKPGDIARFYNGKTAEIKNTDAEGRLILADALSYTVKHYRPDAIFDIATLTGACAYALGPFYAGMMSEHSDLIERLYASASRSGDRVWRLPLHDDYRPAIRSSVADLSNIGTQTYMAGATTAAMFLRNFVDDVPWVHLDIAGVAFDIPDIPYFRPHTATGFGVRLFVDLILNWNKNVA